MREPLKQGMYLGIRCSHRNYSFKVPNQETSNADLSVWDLWSQGEPKHTGDSRANSDGSRSTTFSGWMPVGETYPIGNSIRVAPDLADQAFGDNHQSAEQKVARYKKNAKSILQSLSESGSYLEAEHVRNINKYSCSVFDVQVKLLRVSTTRLEKGKEDPASHLWYQEKVVRRFVLNNGLDKQQLLSLITVIIASKTPISVETGLTVKATTKGGKTSYSVESQASYSGDTDELLSAFNRIKDVDLNEETIFDVINTAQRPYKVTEELLEKESSKPIIDFES